MPEWLGLGVCLVLFGVIVGWWLVAHQTESDLNISFAGLGAVVGPTRAEIEAAVGKPNSVISTDHGTSSCSWHTESYYVALEFKDDICERILSESAA